MAVYLDASALVKLIVMEAESRALAEYLSSRTVRVSATLVRTEVPRAVRRNRPQLLDRAVRMLDGLRMITLDTAVLDRAALVDPPDIRSLDAVHIAAALTIVDELEAIVTYDARMAEAARGLGIPVEEPGRASPR
ncbi:MAG: type II toxin-antitoxin system VapC family toxin [Nitrococcus sp.]|nr:type II toxin-antitoxin system VapC family toxin [Nitrococcus sp.]